MKSLDEMNNMNQTTTADKEQLLKLMRELNFLKLEVGYHFKTIETRRQEINEVENQIKKLCKHDWIVDYVDYDHTVYKCTICHL